MSSFAMNFVGPNAFAVMPANIIRTGVRFRFDYTAAVWSQIKVSFWVSSNPEIQVGTFEAGISLLIQLTFPWEQTVALVVPS